MDLLEAIKARHSVRQYKNIPIETSLAERLHERVAQINSESGLHIQLVTNEPQAFSSKLAHYGKFSGVTNYFAMIGRKGKDLDERIGYFGEQLVLFAQTLGLNTCWVGLTYKKVPDVLHIEKDEKLVCLIAVGYGVNQGAAHKTKKPEDVSKAKEEQPEWFRQGVAAALLAPTALNQQKFRFELCDDHTVKARAGWGFYTETDLGIVKYHFEIAAGKEHFNWRA